MNPQRELAASLYAEGKGYKAIARLLKLSRGTVQRWRRRHGWNRAASPLAQGTASPHGVWMQSLLHDSAHYLVEGVPACSNSPKGARLSPGMSWFPHDGCVRKCTRCMPHAQG